MARRTDAEPGAKTEGGRHEAALSFPFRDWHQGENRPDLFQCSDYLISQPLFLHFTLNHYKCTAIANAAGKCSGKANPCRLTIHEEQEP